MIAEDLSDCAMAPGAAAVGEPGTMRPLHPPPVSTNKDKSEAAAGVLCLLSVKKQTDCSEVDK